MDINYGYEIKQFLKKYEDITRNKIEEGIEWRSKIESDNLSSDDYQNLLKDICKQILSSSGLRGAGVDTQIEKIEERIGNWNLENVERNLSNIITRKDKHGRITPKYTRARLIIRYLKENSISRWIRGLREGDANIPNMGPKSDADFLKAHGFYERVPVDRHTQRFLFRTGILYRYLRKNKSEDVLTVFGGKYSERIKLFEKCLVEFCKEFCDDVYFPSPNGELRLSENPGIIDFAIWHHCAKDQENICRKSEPECDKCAFKGVCLWDMLRFSK